MSIRNRRPQRRRDERRRRGTIVVLSAMLMVAMMAMLAFSVDVGFILVAKDHMQRSADASALAAAWELIDSEGPSGYANSSVTEQNARDVADEYVALNEVLEQSATLASEDVEVGYIDDPSDPNSQLVVGGPNPPNAVRVRVRKTSQQNGEIPLFFARVIGIDDASAEVDATAVLVNNCRGFRTPPSGDNLDMLPFALDKETWDGLQNGIGVDEWEWDDETGSVVPGNDGILEINLYPQGTGSPGNRGTVDIGSSNNSTADIARQIVHGVSPEDLEYHGGELKLDDNGHLFLNADTGISAGVKDELESVKGRPSIIPIFEDVSGNGNNAEYTIVEWGGVRIMEVKLTGNMNSKRVMIQPCNIVTKGAIPSEGEEQTSHYVHSPVWLIR